MRASRLLSIQMLLETRGRLSARALAEELEVSVRTLYRDVDQLSAAGVPVYAERGRHGGFELMAGWKTQLTGLTPSEAQAVFLSGLGGSRGPAADLGLAGSVQEAQLKLLTAMPAAWRDDAQRVHARLHLDPVDWYREPDPVPHLSTVAAAVWDESRLHVRYESWRGEVERSVEPLGLVLKAGIWYLVAGAGEEGGQPPRTYRISNLRHAEVTGERIRRPPGFDLSAHWAESVRRFETELTTGRADVPATPQGMRSLRHWNAAVARCVAAAPAPRPVDGRVSLRIPVEGHEQAAGALLRMVPDVEVQGPAALRRAIVERLRQGARLYGLLHQHLVALGFQKLLFHFVAADFLGLHERRSHGEGRGERGGQGQGACGLPATRLGSTWPFDLDPTILGKAIAQIQVDQALIGHTCLGCHLLEVFHHIFREPHRH